MTKQEAIDHLNRLRDEVWNEDSDGYEYAKAIDMAIEALSCSEKPSMSDTIYRQEEIEVLSEMRSGYNCFDDSERRFYETLSVAIEALSCSEKPNRSDTIYRQDAIEAIMAWMTGTKEYDAIDFLFALPSAQPEIIRCKDCKWYGRADKRRFYRGMDCLQKRIDTIIPDKDFCSKAERRTDETD